MTAFVRGALTAVLLLATAGKLGAAQDVPALRQAADAFAKIDDYRQTMTVHETDGTHTEDKTFAIAFKKPSLERLDIVAGAGRGSGIVWLGGDTVKAHRGGLLRGIWATFGLHDPTVSSLRGDSIDTASIPAILNRYTAANGSLSAAPGPAIGGTDSTAVTLEVAAAAAGKGITRQVLYLSNLTHLPVRVESYDGNALVKSATFSETRTNVGLTAADFPW